MEHHSFMISPDKGLLYVAFFFVVEIFSKIVSFCVDDLDDRTRTWWFDNDWSYQMEVFVLEELVNNLLNREEFLFY